MENDVLNYDNVKACVTKINSELVNWNGMIQ